MTVVDTELPKSTADTAPVEAVPLFETNVNPHEDVSGSTEPLLEVVAPATLPEGYTFDAQADGHIYRVEVPAGGVNEGDTFRVPRSICAGHAHDSVVPTGYWKDGLCDCCRFGCCHPVICNAYWCPMVLLGQVMHRLNLTWLANESRPEGSRASTGMCSGTFGTILFIWIAYLAINIVLSGIQTSFVDPSTGKVTNTTGYNATRGTEAALGWVFYIFLFVLMYKTRVYIRNKYNIRERNCQNCEDCCCVFWCSCCTAAQMARHTADYETYAARCCSETGLPPNVQLTDETATVPLAGSVV